VIPFGINARDWAIDASPAELVPQGHHGAKRPFVLFAGRHVAYKGVDVLLRALEQIEADAVIVGDGPKRGDWERLAWQLKVNHRVSFLGEVSGRQLRDLMHACAVLVLPSVTRAEAFGYVQLEAMACGKPVISTDVPSGVSWVNQHDRTGFVVAAGDVPALATAIDRLMTDASLRTRMGEAARQRVEREFSLTRLRDGLRNLYDEMGLLEAQRQAC
jgi:rhamnosyl/mannosyltransferase